MKHPFYRDRREAVGVNTEAGKESAATRDESGINSIEARGGQGKCTDTKVKCSQTM